MTKRKHRLKVLAGLVVLCALLVTGTCCAEREILNASGVVNKAVSVDPTGRSEGFTAVMYNNLNGLPTADANAIAETDEGFI